MDKATVKIIIEALAKYTLPAVAVALSSMLLYVFEKKAERIKETLKKIEKRIEKIIKYLGIVDEMLEEAMEKLELLRDEEDEKKE